MDLLPSQLSTSDESSCGDSPGPATPVHSPLLHSFTAKGNIEPPLGQIFDLVHRPEFSSLGSPVSSSVSEDGSRGHAVKSVCFIGAGYVGGPTAAVIALFNPDVRVEVVDRDVGRIKRWNSGHLPIHEPSLDKVVRIGRDGAQVTSYHNFGERASDVAWERQPNLFFSNDVSNSIARADIIFLAVNTSTKTFGVGAGKATDMSACDSATKEIAAHARPDTIIVEKSTVPCGTAVRIKSMLRSLRPGVPFEVLSNPEFLAEGSAIENLMKPDRVIIGSANTPSGHDAADMLANLYRAWIPESRILTTNVWSSELSKLVANAMLAQRISSMNSISAICEQTGADVDEIAKSIGLDSRIGAKFLKAGLGFGGSCFRKDIASLSYLAGSLGLEDVAEYWNQVNTMNESQRHRFAKKVIKRLDENLIGKKITILGFAFKAHTGDPRESLAAEVVRLLLVEKPAEIAIYDPYCRKVDMLRELEKLLGSVEPAVHIYTDAYLACSDSNAILIATDCDEFKISRTNASLVTKSTQQPTHSTADDAQPAETFNLEQLDMKITYKFTPQPKCLLSPDSCSECNAEATQEVHIEDTKLHQPLDWRRIFANMQTPRWVFDGRNVLDVKAVENLSMDVRLEGIGKRRLGDGFGPG